MSGPLDPMATPQFPEPETETQVAAELGVGAPAPGPHPDRSPRRIAWARRMRSAGASWEIFKTSAIGMSGLAILVFFALVAILAPLLASETGTLETQVDGPQNAAPSFDYPFGTDGAGRSMLTLVIWGARISLLVGVVATVFALFIGAVVGLSAGYFGGRLDGTLMRLTDWFLVIPWLGLALVLSAILGPGVMNIIIVIGVTSWTFPARVIRAQSLAVSARPYVERARAVGSRDSHIIAHHILPNTMPIIFTQLILTAASAIYTESLLSFLGMGDPNSVSWGSTLDTAFNDGALTAGYWWQIAFPGGCIVLVILALTMVGYAFDQVLNPRLRDR